MTFRRRFTLLLLIALLVQGPFSLPVTSVAAAPATKSELHKVTVIQGKGAPVGCVAPSCPEIDRKIAAFDTQTQFPELGTATEIATSPFPSVTGSMSTGGCAIVNAGLKCWGGNKYGQLGTETTTDSLTSLVVATESGIPLSGVTDVSTTGRTTCVIVTEGAVKCIGGGFGTEKYQSDGMALYSNYGTTWITVLSSTARRIASLSASEICVIKTDGTHWCASSSVTPSWVDSGLTGIADGDSMCLAGTISYCRASGMTSGSWTKVNNADNAEAVYYQANTICFYRLGALWCASQMGGTPYTARLIGMMPKPFAVINMGIDVTSTQMFFVLPDGILTALTSMISCTDCYTSASGVISRLSAFNNSSTTTYNNLVSINGTTNSLDYIPMTVTSDVRANRANATVTVKTQSGEPLVGAAVRWTASDVPGTLDSGRTSTTTSNNGEIVMSLSTGPLAFTVQNGTVKSGATLQAATVTTNVAADGAINVIVPDPPEVVDRKVAVVMKDGAPVPSASISVFNSYLAYAYRFVGTDVATWGAQPIDPKRYFGQVMCSWCFVSPPAYITGADGTITFKTFNTGARSTDRDVDVSYSDGTLSQTIPHNFGTTNDTVTMGNMARTTAAVADADPSTPTLDVKVSNSGQATIEVIATDSTSGTVSGLVTQPEEVCSGMDTGGLWKSTLKIDNICSDVSTTSVSAARVRAASSCPTGSTTSDSTGKISLVLCPSKSTKYRLRGQGAVATLAFCVIVNNKPCGTSTQTVVNSPVATPAKIAKKTLKRKRTVKLQSLLPASKGYKATYRVSGGCRIKKTTLTTPNRKANCRLVMTQTRKVKKKIKKSTKTLSISVK
jgi:hypothetical protein